MDLKELPTPEIQPTRENLMPDLYFFNKCINQTALYPKKTDMGNWYGSIKVDDFKRLEADFKVNNTNKSGKVLPVLETFDWYKQLPRLLSQTIRFIWENNLLSRDDLVSTSQFAGPGNITVIKQTRYGAGAEFDYREYMSKFEFKGWTDILHGKTFLTPPQDRRERNAGIKLYITYDQAGYFANQFYEAAKRIGKAISTDQAYQMAIREISSHEYAHAIAQGLGNKGVDITARAGKFINPKYLKLIGGMSSGDQHMFAQEHICRSFQRMAVLDSLKRDLHFSDAEAQRMFDERYKEERERSLMVLEVMNGLLQKYSFDQLLAMQRSVNSKYKFAKDLRLDPDIRHWFSYDLEPFPADVVVHILKRYSHPLGELLSRTLTKTKIFLNS